MLVWLQRALNDRDAQLDYIAQDNLLAAVAQGDRIEGQVDLLLQHPKKWGDPAACKSRVSW